MKQDFSIIIPSNRPQLAEETKKCLSDFECTIFNGENYPSFSKLINDCILSAENEIIIIANDKVRPTAKHIKKTLFLLKKGFAFVGLYHFGFFAFTKDLIRTIGFFDERFEGGSMSDSDFGRRLVEADLAVYISEETKYEHSKTSWNHEKTIKFYKEKWNETEISWSRLLSEQKYDYDLGPMVSIKKWMPFTNSVMLESSAFGHRKLKFFNDKPVDFTGILNPINL